MGAQRRPKRDPYALTNRERAVNRRAWRREIVDGLTTYLATLRSYHLTDLVEKVASLERPSASRPPPGTSTRAWRLAQARGIAAQKVFAFPEDLASFPKLVGYYRRLTGASLKAVQNAVASCDAYEAGSRTTIPVDLARAYAEVFNEAVSALIEREPTFGEADIIWLIGATSGSQMQGAARTMKGKLAQERVWQWMLEYLARGGWIAELHPRAGALPSVDLADPEAVSRASQSVRRCVLRNGLLLTFGQEPDIAIHEPAGLLLAVHEVKGGIDLAGAKERYPATQRSFEAARRENPACHTVLVVGCVSAAVKRLIHTSGWVNAWYLLPELDFNPSKRREFLNREIRSYALR